MRFSTAGLTLISIVAFTACGSVERRAESDDAAPANPSAPALASKAPDGSPEEMRQQIEALQARIELLESKVSQHFKSMNEKVESTRSSLDQMAALKSPPGQVVDPKPVDVRGRKVDPETSAEAGFTQDSAVKSYRQAMILFRAEKYSEAILAFSAFLQAHADHPLAGAAQYHVGESYFRQKEYQLAVAEFQRVLTSYDRSSHVPQTLRQLAAAEDALKRPEEAKKHRQMLLSLFPHSPAAAGASVAPAEISDEAPAGASSEESRVSAQDLAESELKAGPGLDEPPPTAPDVTPGAGQRTTHQAEADHSSENHTTQ